MKSVAVFHKSHSPASLLSLSSDSESDDKFEREREREKKEGAKNGERERVCMEEMVGYILKKKNKESNTE